MKDINKDNLHIILDHFYSDEVRSLEDENQDILEEKGLTELPEDLEESIKFCEDNGITDHIAYNLMLLEKDLRK